MEEDTGLVYAIKSECGLVYFGSTESTLDIRLNQHIKDFGRFIEGTLKTFLTSFELIYTGEFDIHLMEKVPIDELKMREGDYMLNYECVNNDIPGRTQSEYISDNKEIIKKKRRVKYMKNRISILQQWKVYRSQNIDIIKERNKYQYEKNREERNKYQANYGKKEIYCDICCTTMRTDTLSRHKKTKKHLKNISKI